LGSSPRSGLELHVAHPDRHAALGDAQPLSDVEERVPFSAQAAGLLALTQLAPVAHRDLRGDDRPSAVSVEV
jgi:hypothetical protein